MRGTPRGAAEAAGRTKHPRNLQGARSGLIFCLAAAGAWIAHLLPFLSLSLLGSAPRSSRSSWDWTITPEPGPAPRPAPAGDRVDFTNSPLPAPNSAPSPPTPAPTGLTTAAAGAGAESDSEEEPNEEQPNPPEKLATQSQEEETSDPADESEAFKDMDTATFGRPGLLVGFLSPVVVLWVAWLGS